MTTVRTSGSVDPPQTTTNVIGVKRIRKALPLVAGVSQLTVGDLRACLPLTTPELRITKLSVWGLDGTQISVVFPIGNTPAGIPGDNAVWVDEGTTGQQRAQIHLQPCFEYRNFWITPAVVGTTLVATFGSAVAIGSLICDITLQYRTAVQSCPALDYLRELQFQEEQIVDLFMPE